MCSLNLFLREPVLFLLRTLVATPPHLDVSLHLGWSLWMHGSLQFSTALYVGVVQLVFDIMCNVVLVLAKYVPFWMFV